MSFPQARGQHTGLGGHAEEDLGPGLAVLGGLFLLFTLENTLALLRRRKLVSDALVSPWGQPHGLYPVLAPQATGGLMSSQWAWPLPPSRG